MYIYISILYCHYLYALKYVIDLFCNTHYNCDKELNAAASEE